MVKGETRSFAVTDCDHGHVCHSYIYMTELYGNVIRYATKKGVASLLPEACPITVLELR